MLSWRILIHPVDKSGWSACCRSCLTVFSLPRSGLLLDLWNGWYMVVCIRIISLCGFMGRGEKLRCLSTPWDISPSPSILWFPSSMRLMLSPRLLSTGGGAFGFKEDTASQVVVWICLAGRWSLHTGHIRCEPDVCWLAAAAPASRVGTRLLFSVCSSSNKPWFWGWKL
jgi:hypothetical protein